MKKRIIMLLYASVLTLELAVSLVMASVDPYCSVEVETYTYGPPDELCVNKVYRLSASDDPSGIPMEDFEYSGRRYCLLGIIADNTESEVVTYTAIYGSAELTEDEKHSKVSDGPGSRLFTLYVGTRKLVKC